MLIWTIPPKSPIIEFFLQEIFPKNNRGFYEPSEYIILSSSFSTFIIMCRFHIRCAKPQILEIIKNKSYTIFRLLCTLWTSFIWVIVMQCNINFMMELRYNWYCRKFLTPEIVESVIPWFACYIQFSFPHFLFYYFNVDVLSVCFQINLG